MKELLKKHLNTVIVVALSLGFFLFISLFIFINQPSGYSRWSSPDETANYFFASLYGDSGQLSFYDEAGSLSQGWTVPRSMRSDFGYVKPVSFLGLPLIYGSLASILGQAAIPFLTPLFAALGILLFYFLNRRLFGERIALLSAFLLAFFPVYIYYSIRAMFHNILFIFLLLAGLYLLSLVISSKKRKGVEEKIGFCRRICGTFFRLKPEAKRFDGFLASLFSGVFIGLAAITRTSEVLWLFPVLFLLWVFYARRFGLINLLYFFCGLFIAVLPFAYYNQILYGSFFYGGYNELNRSIDEVAATGSGIVSSWRDGLDYWRGLYEKAKGMIFYFGFKPEQSWEMFQAYSFKMFPYLVWPGVIGGGLLLILSLVRFKRKHVVYILSGLLLSAFLIFYYGSWKFSDNPNPDSTTIGNSYTRYWLPIYIWLMPLAGFLLLRVTDSFLAVFKRQSRVLKMVVFAIQASIIILYASWSIDFVLFKSEEGLSYWRYNNAAEREAISRVFSRTETGSIIVTRYHDKFLFPFRRVIVGSLPDDDISRVLSGLADDYPVYYYNFYLDEPAVAYLNSSKLVPYGLKMSYIAKTGPKFALYKIEKVQ